MTRPDVTLSYRLLSPGRGRVPVVWRYDTVGIRQTLSNGGIRAREQGYQLITLGEQRLHHLALGHREPRRTPVEFGTEIRVEGLWRPRAPA